MTGQSLLLVSQSITDDSALTHARKRKPVQITPPLPGDKQMAKVLVFILFSIKLFTLSCGPESALDKEINWEFTPQVRSASFVGANLAWLVTVKNDFFVTADGGKQWQRIPAEVVAQFNDISFIDALHGWAIDKGGRVWESRDGGRNWISIASLDYEDAKLAKIRFLDSSHGWLVDLFSIWRTEDGGINWKRHIPSDGPNEIKELTRRHYFINAENGWLCGESGLYNTTDGGKTWHGQRPIGGGVDITSVSFVDEQTGWFSSAPKSKIYCTYDGGNSWQARALPIRNPYIYSVHFVNGREGWAVGTDRKDGAITSEEIWGIVMHTTDGGRTWQDVKVGENELFYDRVYFSDSQHGWICARDNVYHTDDGGRIWFKTLSLPPVSKN